MNSRAGGFPLRGGTGRRSRSAGTSASSASGKEVVGSGRIAACSGILQNASASIDNRIPRHGIVISGAAATGIEVNGGLRAVNDSIGLNRTAVHADVNRVEDARPEDLVCSDGRTVSETGSIGHGGDAELRVADGVVLYGRGAGGCVVQENTGGGIARIGNRVGSPDIVDDEIAARGSGGAKADLNAVLRGPAGCALSDDIAIRNSQGRSSFVASDPVLLIIVHRAIHYRNG